MRAKIVGMIVLTGFAALTTSFTPMQDLAIQETHPRLLTEEEADCLVGGKATCFETAALESYSCLNEAGIDFTDIESSYSSLIVFGWCTLEGAWAGVECAWDWLTGLF